MDLTIRDNIPLPPAPTGGRGSSPASAQPDLVRQLRALEDVLGHPVPTQIIPGNLPSLNVTPAELLTTSAFLRDHLGFALLSCVSGADMGDHLEVVYHVRNLETNWLLQMKVIVPPRTNEVDTVMSIWPTANWLERETFDMFGIIFVGHPDLRRILLDDEFEGYPLLKSFRPTPMTHHDSATTQVDPQRAIAGEAQRGIGPQRAIPNILSQGDTERLHPGTPTFGSTQFHGRDFPPETWRHILEGQHGEPDKKP